jgi:hypothetical protein
MAISSATFLAPADTAHSHTADALTLAITLTLAPADAMHSHTVDSAALTAQSMLAIARAVQAHTAEGITLTITPGLAVDSGFTLHTADELVLEPSGAAIVGLVDNVLLIDRAIAATLAGTVYSAIPRAYVVTANIRPNTVTATLH